MKKIFLAGAMVLLLAGNAESAPFAMMDTDGNKGLCWEEFSAAHPNMKEAAFNMIDKDGDKIISATEWNNFQDGHGKGGMGMGGSMGASGDNPMGKMKNMESMNGKAMTQSMKEKAAARANDKAEQKCPAFKHGKELLAPPSAN